MSIDQGARAFSVSTTDRCITSHAGAVLIRAAAGAVGLVSAISEHLHLKARARGLSEAQFIVGIAEAIALGATCLDDLAVARADGAQQQLRGFAVPPPQTAGSFLRRFTLGHIRQFDKALRVVHLKALEMLGITAGETVTLDFDSTYIRSYSSRRQGADPTWTKRYTLHPLLCFVSAFGLCLHAKLRRGKANTSRGIVSFIDECLRRIPAGVGVRARFDSGFFSAELFAKLERKGVTYLCAAPMNTRIAEAIAHIAASCWSPCVDKDEGEVAEFGYRLAKEQVFRRYIVKRIAIAVGEQAELGTLGYHYWVHVTNDHTSEPAVLESEHRHKAQVENGMRELKENFGLDTLRKHGFMANWAWVLLVVTALNLTRWVQLLGGLDPEGDLHAKRLRYRYLTVPALLVSSGRSLILRLQRGYPLFERFTAALSRLQSLPLPAG